MKKNFWEKRGLLFNSDMQGYTHASHPSICKIDDRLFLIAFSSRKDLFGNIFFVHATIKDGEIKLVGRPKLALSPSSPGYFDSEGLLNCCFAQTNGAVYMYYSGWQNIQSGLWHCDTGRAIVDPINLTAKREFDGPVLGRDKHNPIFAAATSVEVDSYGVWHTWYNKGIKWERVNNGWHPTYGIHYATSPDGVDWNCRPGLIIDLKDSFEHSFGRPSVVHWDGKYQMWFACRGRKNDPTYRIGYAWSEDRIHWTRDDSNAGIDVSTSGWDSEAVCYPYLIEEGDFRYMLYNGNNYGKTGFGYAVMRR